MDVMTKVIPESETRPDISHDGGDRERFAHYVQKDKITESAVTGTRRSFRSAPSARRSTTRCWPEVAAGRPQSSVPSLKKDP